MQWTDEFESEPRAPWGVIVFLAIVAWLAVIGGCTVVQWIFR